MKENYLKRILHGTGSVWVSEEEIKDGDKYYNSGYIYEADRHYKKATNDRKIIAQTKLTPALDGIAHIELPEEEDIEKLAHNILGKTTHYGREDAEIGSSERSYYETEVNGFITGHKTASKDKKYSEIEIRKGLSNIYNDITEGATIDWDELINNLFQSLAPKSNDNIIGAELVMEETRFPSEQDIIIEERPKVYLNKAGQIYFEVKQFIYK